MDMSNTDVLVLTASHPEYPIAVRAMGQPPTQLFVRGVLPHGKSVAIVGTRRASQPALRFAHDLAAQACEKGWSVWSGGALGIDTAAHRGALEAHGKTVVVMGTGFNHPYPQANRCLFDSVLQHGGAWLSPYPPEQVGARWTFLPRNELLASLVDHVVVVQAPVRSGARSTASAARRMGKGLWVVPSSPWDVLGAGSLLELGQGAKVLFDPCQLLGGVSQRKPRAEALDSHERAIVEVVTQSPAHLDTICQQTGLSVAEVSAAALSLVFKKVLLEAGDGLYRLDARAMGRG
jgi:DNA processing protein